MMRQDNSIYNLSISDHNMAYIHQIEQNTSDQLENENFDVSVNISSEDGQRHSSLQQQDTVELSDDMGRISRNSNMTTSATQTSDTDCQREMHPAESHTTTGSSMLSLSSIYQGEWPIDGSDKVLWVSGPSCIGEKDSLSGLVNQDTCSIMSFSSTGMTSNSMNARRFHAHQLGTKVEMVYSLLSMLGTHDKEDMSRTLLAMSSSQDSCIAMRQSGCLPLLIQLLHGGERDTTIDEDPRAFRQVVRDARRRASQALHNIVHAHPDDKRGRREARVLRLLEQIRDYCDLLRDIDSGFVEDNNNNSIDQHPGPAIAALMKLSFDEEHRHAMCQLGGLQAIAELIQIDHEVHGNTSNQYCVTIRRYAGMALTNLTFGDGTNKALLCSMKNFMIALVAQLHSPSEDLRQVTASVLRNLSWRADTASKQMLREVGAVTTLMKAAMGATKESILKSILSALWNLSAHCTMNKADICAVDGALAFLVSMLTYKSSSKTLAIVENGGGILRNISSHIAVKEDYRAILRRHNCLQILLQQLKSPSLTVVSNACGTLWNLSARCHEDQQALWEMGAVGMLRNLVHSKHKMISMGSSAALRNLLSVKPAGMTLGLSRSMNGTTQCTGNKNMPSLLVRKQRALEAEIDQNLSETCDNIDSPKTSPTHTVTENRFTFGCQGNKQAQYTGYLPGRMYLSINGYISSPDGVSRSESRDSIGSTHSEPLPPHLIKNSYQIFAKSARLMLLGDKHPRRPLDFHSMDHTVSKDDHSQYGMSVFPGPISRIEEMRIRESNSHLSNEELHISLPRPNSLPSVRRETPSLLTNGESSRFRRAHSNGNYTNALITGMQRTKFYPTHRRINSCHVEKDLFMGESHAENAFSFTQDKFRKRSMPPQINKYVNYYEHLPANYSRSKFYGQDVSEEKRSYNSSFQYFHPDQVQRNRDETVYLSCMDQTGSSVDQMVDYSDKYHEIDFQNQSAITGDKTALFMGRRHAMHEYKPPEYGSSLHVEKGPYSEASGIDDTPLMFSPSSSQCSLSSFEQHSIHEDCSSIISDTSHRNSLMLSPSDIPESPGFARPSTPNTFKQPISQFTDVAPKPDSEGIICPTPKILHVDVPGSIENYTDEEFCNGTSFPVKFPVRNKRFKHTVYSDSEILNFKIASSSAINGKIKHSSNRAQSSESLLFGQKSELHRRGKPSRREIDSAETFGFEGDNILPTAMNMQIKNENGIKLHSEISHNSHLVHHVESTVPTKIDVQNEIMPPPPPPPPPPLFSRVGDVNRPHHFSSLAQTQHVRKSTNLKSNSTLGTAADHSELKYGVGHESRFVNEPTIMEDPSQVIHNSEMTGSTDKNATKKCSNEISPTEVINQKKKLIVDINKPVSGENTGISDYEEKWKKDEQLQEKYVDNTTYNYCNGDINGLERLQNGSLKILNGKQVNCPTSFNKRSSTSSNSSPEGAISSSNGHKDISESSRIRKEAKKIAEEVEAEVENLVDELTQSSVSCVSDIDNILPPSVMGEGLSLSMTSSGLSDMLSSANGKLPTEKRHSMKKSRKSMKNHGYFHETVKHVLHVDTMKISSGSEILEAVQPPSGMDAIDNLSMKSSGTSDALDNVNPPSVMDELSMTGSCASLNSISSDILESRSHSRTDMQNGKSNNSEMFQRLNAAAAMVQVYSRELSNIMTGSMKSSYNSDIIDQVKPPSAFQEITEVTVEDGTEVASDTLATDTELEEELPHDDEASAPSCETIHAFDIFHLRKREQREGNTENLVNTIHEEILGTDMYNKKKLIKNKNILKEEEITAEEALALQENANLVVSTIQEIKNKSTVNEMVDDEIISLVSIESEDNIKREKRGPRIVKPINRETIRQMQEKKNAEKTPKGIRGRGNTRTDIRNNLLTNASKQNAVKTLPPSVKPTRTSALRASQNQRSGNRNSSRLSNKSPASSYLSLSRPLTHIRNTKVERTPNNLGKENIPLNTDLRNITTIEINGEHSSTDSDDGKPKLLIKQGTFTKDKPSQNAPHISHTSPRQVQRMQHRSTLIKSDADIHPIMNGSINGHLSKTPEIDKSNLSSKGTVRRLINGMPRTQFISLRKNNNNTNFKRGNNLKTSPSAQNLGRQVNEKKYNSKRSPSAIDLSSRTTLALGSSQSTASNASSLSSLSSGASIKKGPMKDVPSKIAFLWKKSASDGCTSDGGRSRGAFISKLKSDIETNKPILSRSLTLRTRSSLATTSSSGDGLSRSSTYDKLSQESSQSSSQSDRETPKRPTTLAPTISSDKRHPVRSTPIKGIVHCHHSHDIRTPPATTWKKTRVSQRRSTTINSSAKISKTEVLQNRGQISKTRKHISIDSIETSDENETIALKPTVVNPLKMDETSASKNENEDHQNSNMLDLSDIGSTKTLVNMDEVDKSSSKLSESEEESSVDNRPTNTTSHKDVYVNGESDLEGDNACLVTTV